MTYVGFTNRSSSDAFGRLRMSQAQSQFEVKFLQNSEPLLHNDLTVGGGTIVYNYSRASVALNVGTASGDKAIRESHRYATYIPGNSTLFVATGVLGPAKANLVTRIGIFNDENGLFFERNATDVRIVIRSNTSGSILDTNFVTQANWNVDKLDGTGSSRITLDVTKAQIFFIDYQWLGYGRIRFGFDFGGQVVYCHEARFANQVDTPYMRRPSLPCRYEIVNTGITASASTLIQTCYAIKTEGPTLLQGNTFSLNMGITPRAITTRQPIMALRLKNSFDGNTNRRQVRVQNISLYTKTNDCLFEFVHVHSDWTSTTGGTWVSVDTVSGAEYNIGITAVTGGTQHLTDSFYVASSQGSFGQSLMADTDIVGSHSWINQNIDSTKSEIAVIFATALSGTANVLATLSFSEVD